MIFAEGQGEERGDVRRAAPVRVPGPPLGMTVAAVLVAGVVVLVQAPRASAMIAAPALRVLARVRWETW